MSHWCTPCSLKSAGRPARRLLVFCEVSVPKNHLTARKSTLLLPHDTHPLRRGIFCRGGPKISDTRKYTTKQKNTLGLLLPLCY